jgi:hypoxanthine phosphoribosyltransferase
MTTGHSPSALLAQADCLHSADAVDAAIDRIAQELTAALVEAEPVVMCVMTGGLFFSGQLLGRLAFPLHLDYVHASRYQNNTAGTQLSWQAQPKLDLTGRTVLLLDDILDEGITLLAIKERCLALGAKAVLTAVLVEKNLPHAKPMQADFVGLTVPNRYVFGCGMDAYGWWRNLPAIYALN